jgi:hypothetical protein
MFLHHTSLRASWPKACLYSCLLTLDPVFAFKTLSLRPRAGIRDMYRIIFVFLYNKLYITIYMKVTPVLGVRCSSISLHLQVVVDKLSCSPNIGYTYSKSFTILDIYWVFRSRIQGPQIRNKQRLKTCRTLTGLENKMWTNAWGHELTYLNLRFQSLRPPRMHRLIPDALLDHHPAKMKTVGNDSTMIE